MSKSSAIPMKFLEKMDTFSGMNVHGEIVTVTVDVGDSKDVTQTRIADFRTHLQRNNVEIVGVDLKTKAGFQQGRPNLGLLALYASNRCLIFHFQYNEFPKAVHDFLDDPNICFVGPSRTTTLKSCRVKNFPKDDIIIKWDSVLVSAGTVAARVLKIPSLAASDLGNIAVVARVPYNGVINGTGSDVVVDQTNPMVLTENMVKNTINDAVAHYLIASKLLSSNATIKSEP